VGPDRTEPYPRPGPSGLVESLDLTELNIEEGEGLPEYKDVDKEEEEEDDVEEHGNEKEELVSSQDMEHCAIVVAQ